MTFVLTDVRELSCEWLTEILLPYVPTETCSIETIRVGAIRHGPSASVTPLRVKWIGCEDAAAPTRLLLKMASSGLSPVLNRETFAYAQINQQMDSTHVLPTCYHWGHCSRTGLYHILMADMSLTHYSIPEGLPPTETEAKLMVSTLARLHASWWDRTALESLGETSPTEFQIRRFFGYAESHFDVFCHLLEGRWLSDDKHMCWEILSAGTELALRQSSRQIGRTIVHGDAHAQNFLLPRDGMSRKVYLIDWQMPSWMWRVSVGAFDIAYLTARFWPQEQYAAFGGDLIGDYYRLLLENGIEGATWEGIWGDYQLGLCMNLGVLIHEALCRPATIWYPQLRHLLVTLRENWSERPCVKRF